MIARRQTLIGRLETGMLVAGQGPEAQLAARVIDMLSAAPRWRDVPRSLWDWAVEYGAADPAFDLLLHLDDRDPCAMAPPPEQGGVIRQVYDPFAPRTDAQSKVERLQAVAPLAAGERLGGPLRDLLSPPEGMTLYAVIDGAGLVGLPERLENEGLSHCCLFRNDARDQMGDVAPWLVKLSPEAPLLLDLLRANGAGGFHREDAAVFLHADAPLDAVEAHLRHYTKLPTEDGSWVYLRYWDRLFRTWISDRPGGPMPSGFWGPRPGAPRAVIGRVGDRDWMKAMPEAGATYPDQGFLPAYKRFSRLHLRRRFLDRMSDALDEEVGLDVAPGALAWHYRMARDAGFRRERALARWIEASVRLAPRGLRCAQFDDHPEIRAAVTMSDVHRADVLLDVVRAYGKGKL